MKRSIAFYERLGFSCEPYGDGTQYAFLTMDRLSVHLGLSDSPKFIFNPCGVYFYVDAVDAFFDRVRAAGVGCASAPGQAVGYA